MALVFILVAVAPAVKYALDRRAGNAILDAPLCTPYVVVECLSSIATTVTGNSVGKGTRSLRLAGPEPAADTYMFAIVAMLIIANTVYQRRKERRAGLGVHDRG